ncbi:MAG: hypothetical protein M3Q88_03770 [Pseudomonadota bacterium]|nr:hypothetical protein [Pseudomonadota bacterium]
MPVESDLEYYQRRAVAERKLGEEADDPSVALIHAKLAARYDRLAAGLNQPHPVSRSGMAG